MSTLPGQNNSQYASNFTRHLNLFNFTSLKCCTNQKCANGSQTVEFGILFQRPVGEEPDCAIVALHQTFVDHNG